VVDFEFNRLDIGGAPHKAGQREYPKPFVARPSRSCAMAAGSSSLSSSSRQISGEGDNEEVCAYGLCLGAQNNEGPCIDMPNTRTNCGNCCSLAPFPSEWCRNCLTLMLWWQFSISALFIWFQYRCSIYMWQDVNYVYIIKRCHMLLPHLNMVTNINCFCAYGVRGFQWFTELICNTHFIENQYVYLSNMHMTIWQGFSSF
jgi:hypothetical protein